MSIESLIKQALYHPQGAINRKTYIAISAYTMEAEDFRPLSPVGMPFRAHGGQT